MVSVAEIVGVYGMWLIVFGTVGNLVTCLVCYQLRKNTTFVFLGFISLSDIISLYYWNLKNFLNVYYAFDLSKVGILMCRIASYSQLVSLFTSTWLLVSSRLHDLKNVEK